MFEWIRNLFSGKEEDIVSAMSIMQDYFLNDPGTSNLRKKIIVPPTPKKLNFVVKGHSGPAPLGTAKGQAMSCHITLANCINYMQSMIGQFRKPIDRWAHTQTLHVDPRAGKQFNAYYNRNCLKFFFSKARNAKKIIYTADSADIVAHELGHAILDSLKPNMFHVQGLELWAFHESFADITAILSVMQHNEIMQKALKQTKGDLMRPNVISKIAEQVGNAIFSISRGRDGRKPGSIRDATDVFIYQNPKKLPQKAPVNELARESHSFGRVFLGAWYQLMVEIYNKNIADKMGNRIECLSSARDTAARYVLKSVVRVPSTAQFLEAIAKGMIVADKEEGGKYSEILDRVFTYRNLIQPRVRMMSNTDWNDIRKNLQKDDQVVGHKNGLVAKLSRPRTLRLSDHLASSLSDCNPLYDVEVEVPADSYYEFNQDGILVDEVLPNEEEIIMSTALCLDTIFTEDSVGSDKMWEVQDNKLIRAFIE